MTYSTRRSASHSTAEKSSTSTQPSDNTRPGTPASTDSQDHHAVGGEKSRKSATRRHPLAISPADSGVPVQLSREDVRRSLSNAAIETLEGREYMSASIGLEGNVLVLRADPNTASRMWVNLSHGGQDIQAHITGAKTEQFPVGDVMGVQMFGSVDKHDVMVVSQGLWLPTSITGGNGNDNILGGSGADHITAGNGNNHINARGGNNWISVGSGNDTVHAGAGIDSLYGGSGRDVLVNGGSSHDVVEGVWVGHDAVGTAPATPALAGVRPPTQQRITVTAKAPPIILSKTVGAPKPKVGSGSGSSTGSKSGAGSDAGSGGSGSNSSSGSNSEGSNSGSGSGSGSNGSTSGSGSSNSGSDGSTSGSNGSTSGSGGSTSGSGGTTSGSSGSTSGSGGSTSGSGGSTSGSGGSTSGSGGSTSGTGGSTSGTGGSTSGSGGPTSGTGGSTSGTGGSTTGTGGTTTTVTPTSGSAPAWATQTTLGSVNPGTISFAANTTQANIQTTFATGMAVHTVHFNGLGSKFAVGDALDATYTWNFGDPGSAFNTLTGWIGAHTYDTAGTYTATLTVVDKAGNSSTVSTQITIAANTRRMIYVDSVAGNDSNTGASPDFAVASVARAMQLVTDNCEVLFHNGQTFQVANSCALINTNVLLTTYGTGGQARMEKIKGNGQSIFNIGAKATNCVADGLDLDSMWDMATYGATNKVGVYGFLVTGNNLTVRNCQFHNVDDCINTCGKPAGVLVQNCYFGMEVRGNCIWAQGYDHVYIGNTFTQSNDEHLIRSSDTGTQRILIEDNNFSRPSNKKGALELRTASFFYVQGNVINGGTLRMGLPLYGGNYFTGWGVVQDNETYKIFTLILPGVQHVAYRDNVINYGANGSEIVIQTYNTTGDPEVADIRIDHNTGIDTAASGNFLQLIGKASGISVTNNVFIDTNEDWKGVGSGGMFVQDTDLSSFSEIANNVFPVLPSNTKQVGDNFIYSNFGTTEGFVTNAQWEAMPQVTNAEYDNVQLQPDVYQITLNGVTSGARTGKFNPNAWSVAPAVAPKAAA